jgi:phthalate 4,5-cis-dihydrodiol dehydrogenase
MMEARLRIGAIGLGRAFTLMLPTFVSDPRVELVAGAAPMTKPRECFARDFSAKTYDNAQELCRDPNVDVVYIASPHQFHADHAEMAAAAGKHILVEKPMAINLGECMRMNTAASKANVQLIVGHSHSFDAPILRTRTHIAGGKMGNLRMIQMLNFTDFLYRPRRAEELDTSQGGGVVFSQAVHQIDVARLLGGGQVRSVRALTGVWDPQRATEGAYSALLNFENGTFASLTYNGYSHFDSDEFCGWIGESGKLKDPKNYGGARKSLQNKSVDQEAEMKAARNYGGPSYVPPGPKDHPPYHQHFGFVLASCDRADLRPLPNGVMVYGNEEQYFDKLPAPTVQRAEVIDELFDAVIHGKAPLHSGRWSLATMEVCLALLRSANEGHEIFLSEQVSLGE